MATYKITSHSGSGRPLNVATTSTISGRTNVNIWSDTGSNDQKWSIVSLGSGQQVKSMNNTRYMLNANTSTWNCDVYTSNSDTYVNFKSLGSGLYRIQLDSDQTKYLTAEGTASGSNVKWAALNSSSNAQKWKVELVSSSTPSGSVKIPMPAGRFCCWNQRYSEIVTALKKQAGGTGTKGCTITTALNLVNFYGPDNYTINNIIGAWDKGGQGMTWGWDFSSCGTKLRVAGSSEALSGTSAFPAIRSEIQAGRPVIVNIGTGNGDNHTVMCYGYENGGTAYSDFLVKDPIRIASGGGISTEKAGSDHSLQQAMNNNGHPQGIWSIRRTRSA